MILGCCIWIPCPLRHIVYTVGQCTSPAPSRPGWTQPALTACSTGTCRQLQQLQLPISCNVAVLHYMHMTSPIKSAETAADAHQHFVQYCT